ncbi:MAG: SdpI family protein [Ktedonobacteraceae bacterium]
MDTSDNEREKITPHPEFWTLATVSMVMIVALQIAITVAAYPFLPDQVPSHWNSAGQINAYAPKLIGIGLFPFINITLFAILRGLVKLGPRLTEGGERNNVSFINITLTATMLLMLILQLATIAIALGAQLDMPFVICLLISLLFIVLGNYMGKLRRNFWAGIRTPWTIVNDTTWERTHRLGGWLFVASGLCGIVTSFIPQLRLIGIIGPILVVTVIAYVYSYIVYRRVMASGTPSTGQADPFSK